jgi:hypothetical protein
MRICYTHLFCGSFSFLLIFSATNADNGTDSAINRPGIQNSSNSTSSPLSSSYFKGLRSPLQDIDYQLTLQAQNTLRGGIISKGYENVRVNIKDGHATISGYVENDSARNDITRRILDIDGILDIKDHLSLDPILSSTDRQLTIRARETLKGGVIGRTYDNIIVNVVNGRALVSGLIENENDQNDILGRILAVEGIKGVDNQLTKK